MITRITFSTAKPRKRPAFGDLRTTKKHGTQRREFARARCGAFIVSNGRNVYKWVSV